MQLLSISHFSLWMSVAAIVVLFALLLVARARRQRQGDNTQPETGWEIAHQLGRIADALERSSLSRETQPSEVQSAGHRRRQSHRKILCWLFDSKMSAPSTVHLATLMNAYSSLSLL